MLHVKTGNIFDVKANDNNVLTHACNAQGVWGAGIAAQMLRRFPESYVAYHDVCLKTPSNRRYTVCGRHVLHQENGYYIASLITSEFYGKRVAPAGDILEATKQSVEAMFQSEEVQSNQKLKFHSPRINAGLFKVPWELTLGVLFPLVTKYNVEWTVWVLD